MAWADSQALLNDAVLDAFDAGAVIVATGRPLAATFHVAHEQGDSFGAPVSRPGPQLHIRQRDLSLVPNATEIDVVTDAAPEATRYTVVDSERGHDGMAVVYLQDYGRG